MQNSESEWMSDSFIKLFHGHARLHVMHHYYTTVLIVSPIRIIENLQLIKMFDYPCISSSFAEWKIGTIQTLVFLSSIILFHA